MCLYTRNKQPRVAKKDIRVLKYLRERNGKYYGPYQETPVKLDKLIVAKPNKPQLRSIGSDKFNNNLYELAGGAIHAKLYERSGYGNTKKVAIIPAGSKYWLDSFGREIAATKMIVTEEDGENYEFDSQLGFEILEDAPEENGVKVADYMLEDGTFVHPSKELAGTAPVGRVVGFKKGKPIVASLDILKEMWDTSCDSKVDEYYLLLDEALKKDKDGISKMRAYKKKREDRFHALNACLDYHAENGEEWYMPTLSDMIIMLNNLLYLNAAIAITGIGTVIDGEEMFWTCSEHLSDFSWICYLHCGNMGCYEVSKIRSHSVIPFFASFSTQISTLSKFVRLYLPLLKHRGE